MDWDRLQLSPKIISALGRAKLTSVREVICLSGPDLQRVTNLSRSDIQQLLTAAATACRRHHPIPALHTRDNWESGLRVGVGCPVLDELLRGGLPVGAITELSGESGAGKTQLAMQFCLSVQYPTQYRGLGSGAVYICTEDSFPIRRLQQLIREQSHLRSDVPQELIHSLQFSDQVYIEHAADLGLVRLLVLDSVAALFRSEFKADDWLERNKQLLAFSSTLHHLSQEFTTPVLCINQVTDVFNSGDNSLGPLSCPVSPALGLAWANRVMMRLMMRRLQVTVARGDQSSVLRRLEIIFAPHLPRDGQDIAVWREGVRGIGGAPLAQTHDLGFNNK
ncbi:DNA repair protein XRCC3 isoform X2 [Echeneis naucrates]|uniref:DNA repair protein XRCC3 isoform X2 n=1 Tax=Echeneis naucrates TaxID=173247 RepID=UPI0011143FD6|nr:DNA repair protein XRCC3 isoform X2 [Echeneis naucrates]